MDLLYKINALVVGRIKNVKFEHDFCTNNWFFSAQKGRCALLLNMIWHLSSFHRMASSTAKHTLNYNWL